MHSQTEITYSGSENQIIDLGLRRERKQRNLSIYLEAMEGIHELRSHIADYDFFMSVLALEMAPQSPSPLTAEAHIQQDLRRLNDLVDALEATLNEQHGISLETALHLLKKQAKVEVLSMLDELANTDCPFLNKMHEILQA